MTVLWVDREMEAVYKSWNKEKGDLVYGQERENGVKQNC